MASLIIVLNSDFSFHAFHSLILENVSNSYVCFFPSVVNLVQGDVKYSIMFAFLSVLLLASLGFLRVWHKVIPCSICFSQFLTSASICFLIVR